MKRLLILFILLSKIFLNGSSLSEIKTKIKQTDFIESNNLLEAHISANPDDSEAFVYKCFSDIGYFFEKTLPDYLVENLNTKATKTENLFNYDESVIIPEPISVTLEVEGQSEPYPKWLYYPGLNYPVEAENLKDVGRLYEIFNLTIESKSLAPFTISEATETAGAFIPSSSNSGISFVYNGDSKQCNFLVSGSDSIYIFLNGKEIGYTSSGASYIFKNITSDMGDYFYAENIIPLYLHNGDIISFETNSDSNGEYSSDPAGIRPMNPYDFTVQNGVSYNLVYPNLGEDITIEDIFSIITREDLPTRILISQLIANLDNFRLGDSVTIDTQFYAGEPKGPQWDNDMMYQISDYNDIVLQKADAQAILAILKILNAMLGVSDQYNFNLLYDYDVLSNLKIFKTAKQFFDSYQTFLEINDGRISDQEDTQTELNSALDDLKASINTIWYRGEPTDLNTDYLIEKSDSSDAQEYANIINDINTLKASVNGFENSNNISGDPNGGFEFTLVPFMGATPFPTKAAILDAESLLAKTAPSNQRGTLDDMLLKYGVVRNVLPEDFSGKILVFEKSNGSISRTFNFESDDIIDGDDMMWGNDGYVFDQFSGEFTLRLDGNRQSVLSNDSSSASENETLTLSYETDNEGTWTLEEYSYDGYSNQPTITQGRFFYYSSSLDIDSNGIADHFDLNKLNSALGGGLPKFSNNLSYSGQLNRTNLQRAELEKFNFLADDIYDKIMITKSPSLRDPGYGYSDNYSDTIEFYYFATKNDLLKANYGQWGTFSVSDYSYQNGILGINDDEGGDHDDFDDDGEDFTSKILHFENLYSGQIIEDGESEPTRFILYPSEIDLDEDGLADKKEFAMGILPSLVDDATSPLPTSDSISLAIQAHQAELSNSGNQDDNNNGEENNNFIDQVNPNALSDSDNDNMPDILESQFGGDLSNPNDAINTVNEILTNTYTQTQLIDLRLGSTLYEVNGNLATFNIILEESTDLTNWTAYGEYSLELDAQNNDGTKFFRFKMGE